MTRDCLLLPKKKKAYARAGVDVDLANKLKRGIGAFVRQTHGPQVLGKIGGFGGLFRASFPGMRDPVLVASVDGEPIFTGMNGDSQFEVHGHLHELRLRFLTPGVLEGLWMRPAGNE